MAKLALRKFRPTPADASEGATPMDKAEIIEQLAKYKLQNPVKYEAKKAALFARYGLTEDAVPEPVKDASDIELETLKAKAKK
jgi:hypothetical protein